MLDENQLVSIKWYSGNKKYLTELGYEFTKMNDIIEIPFNLVKQKSKVMVKARCDYCGEEYETRYCNYELSASRGKVACKKCKQRKIQDTLESKYGSTSLWGVPEFRKKAKESMVEKYGHEYAFQSPEILDHFKETMVEKFGCDNPIKCPKLQAKAKATMYANGKVPTSKPESKIADMLISLYGKDNCFPGYPVDKVNLDCLVVLNDKKIDVEYDGLYWHKDTEEYDRRRNHWLISLGYKVLRIKGDKNDDLPTIDRLKEEVDYLMNGHSLGYIDMNN